MMHREGSLPCQRVHVSFMTFSFGALMLCALPEAAAGDPRYDMPPKPIADLIDAPATPGVSLSPDRSWMLIMDRPNLPDIAEVAQPELRLAGLRINPRTNGRSRTFYATGLTLKRLTDLAERPVTGLPQNPRIGAASWSPDGGKVAFAVTREKGIELWVLGVATGQAKRLTEPRLNGAYGSSFDWLSDSRTLVCRLLSADRGPAPAPPLVPAGPTVQENIGRRAPARTYQDLLQNADDEAMFDHYLTSSVTLVSLDGQATPIGEPGIIAAVDPSPDGKYLLVHTVHRPYSYLVPVYRFPRRVEVWDRAGKVVRLVADLPLQDQIPIAFDATSKGPRSIGWRSDVPATLYWVEAQDEGDPAVSAEVRDRVYTLAAPFQGEPVALSSLGLRYAGIDWGSDGLALVSERWWKTRRTRTWIVNPSSPGSSPTILFDRSSEDRYGDPGDPLTRRTDWGTSVLLTADGGRTLFLSGRGASPEGDRPFLDTLDLASKQTQRLFHSDGPYYEAPVDLLDPDARTLLTRRESPTDPANYFVRDLRRNDLKQITEFPHPTPQLKDVYKELLHYERADGVKLTGTLYLPPGKKPSDGPFPMLMWAYPQEFKSADAAGQVTDSPYRFVRVRPQSPLLWLIHGYAVLNNPSLPIVGEGTAEPNDTYVKQLVDGARAAVEEVVRLGVADRDHIAIGGHSYGAFMTANLLSHCDLFRAGIARSGAYNRTLTPFGFQAEERSYWQAPEIYHQMSPFSHVTKVNEPILLIHGEADNNSGTFPMQSERYYNALKGHGATARLVMLPHESHGYRARESVMHVAAEMTAWLDKYVRDAAAREEAPATDRDPAATVGSN